jgi:hypothetical protein
VVADTAQARAPNGRTERPTPQSCDAMPVDNHDHCVCRLSGVADDEARGRDVNGDRNVVCGETMLSGVSGDVGRVFLGRRALGGGGQCGEKQNCGAAGEH